MGFSYSAVAFCGVIVRDTEKFRTLLNYDEESGEHIFDDDEGWEVPVILGEQDEAYVGYRLASIDPKYMEREYINFHEDMQDFSGRLGYLEAILKDLGVEVLDRGLHLITRVL